MRRTTTFLFTFLILLNAIAGEQWSVQRRSRKVADSDPLTGGETEAIYFVDIEIGVPPQIFTVAFDTGSSDLLVVGSSCTECSVKNSPYNPGSSANSSVVNCYTLPSCACSSSACQIRNDYGDGSYANSVLYQDIIGLGPHKTQAFVGDMTSETLTRGSLSDGILGMAYQGLTAAGNPTVWQLMVENLGIPDIFSFCVGDEDGVIDLGGVDPSHFTGNIQYTPITHELYYGVSLKSISLDSAGSNILASIDSTISTIVDTGTTDIILPQSSYQAIVSAISPHCQGAVCNVFNLQPGYCLKMSQSSVRVSTLPTLYFNFDDGTGNQIHVPIPPENYMRFSVSTPSDNPLLCVDIGITGSTDSNQILLGDGFLRGVYTVFDRANKRIGFATPQNCGTSYSFATVYIPVWGWLLIVAGSGVFICVVIAIIVALYRRRKRQTGYQPLNS